MYNIKKIDLSDFKIDINKENNEQVHDLYIRIVYMFK
ncbi:MAG: hypothetical protein K0R09_584 [Clostridiales bacterium]|jgi:hypothetical protein|nr:hypothetical protein [Clostridiales bacterium]